MRIKSLRKYAFNFAFAVLSLHLVFIQVTVPVILLYRFVNPPVTGVMLYRAIGFGWENKKVDYLPIEKIPKTAKRMILKVEDGTFYQHHGVLLAAMKNAWSINKQIGRPVYGGSTITMQTARTVFLAPVKSYLRKYLEVIIALEMEVILGKDRIFEIYLNYAEWGKGIYGINSASLYHYGRGVWKISTDETIRLVTLLSSPVKYSPYTINKSGILRSRYEYLTGKFNSGN
jgi:monofunctional biosynthetic peptidoglycan transglycosylase